MVNKFKSKPKTPFKKFDNGILINSDCVQGMQSIKSNSINLIVTSPPYNVGIIYDSWNDLVTWERYYIWCKKWLEECFRILKEDGRMYINHYLSVANKNKKRSYPLMKINSICCEEIGFKHHGLAFWPDITLIKKTAWGSWISASAPYVNSPFEGILVLYKKEWKRNKKGISTIGKLDFINACRGVWNINPSDRDGVASFPIELPSICINLLSYKNDIILDPFMGHGSTGCASVLLNRKFIGFEISKNYFKKSILKIKSYIAKKKGNNFIKRFLLQPKQNKYTKFSKYEN